MTAIKAKLPYLKTVSTLNVDALSEDGELYTAEKRIQVVVEEDKGFMLMYNYFFGLLHGIDSIVDVKVMMWIQENANYNSNVVTLNKFFKEKIREHTTYSLSAIDRSIAVLREKGFLIKDETCARCAIYNINPTYLWYGDSKKREGYLKMTLEMQQSEKLPDLEKQREADIKRLLDKRKQDNI